MTLMNGLKLTAAAIILAVISVQAVNSIRTVNTRIDALTEAHSGDMLWSFSQIETEFHRLSNAIIDEDHPDHLQHIKFRFDLFYSRVSILRDGDLFEEFRVDPQSKPNFDAVQTYLETLHLHLDNAVSPLPAKDLLALQIATQDVQPAIRAIVLMGFDNAADHSLILRESTRATLFQLLVLAVYLIVGLAVTSLILRRMYVRGQTQTDEMQRSQARVQAMVSTALDGILVTTREGMVIETNQAANDIFRLPKDEQPNVHLSTLVQGLTEQEFYCPSDSGLANQGRLQTTGMRREGNTFPVEISLTRLAKASNEDGDSVVYVAYVRDISERLMARQTIIEARDKALAGEKAKSKLLAVMNHEIRTPLNGIKGALELLKGTKLSQDQNRYADAIETSGNILSDHVENILSLTRQEDPTVKPTETAVDLHHLIDDLIESQSAAAGKNGNRLVGICASDIPKSVTCDASMLQQALLNLIGNAIKFTQQGEIRLEVDRCAESNLLEFRVSDTGQGIEQHELPKLFEDFYSVDRSYSRPQSGIGLGLGIAQRLVQAMGGQIHVESIRHEGSLFWFRLPLLEDLVTQPETQTRITSQTTTPRRILLVDDNDINRMVTGELLYKAGHCVKVAASGAKAIELANRETFDVILMDISMPGLDGFAAAKQIRQSTGASAKAPIVALTAQSIGIDAPEIKDAQMTGVLSKPLSLSALWELLESHSASARPTMEHPILDQNVIADIFENLQPDQINGHFHTLSQESDAFLKHCYLQNQCPVTAEQFANDRHQLAGAAAVLGLSAFSKAVSDVPIGTKTAAACKELQPLWQQSQTAFSRAQKNLTSNIDLPVTGGPI
ncbi:MAG: response regulator [Cognatishimia sp.]|uniref:hybrid sensor histidine kinase/response regulator n=1 Tax=Cognatishimia sp. TaxID=2211648 RepID=UPI003B8E7192